MSMAEVLVALFLMALGSIAILTMFPLGMYHMGQALKDDRTAQSAAQADAYMRMYWRANVIENTNRSNSAVTGYPGYEPFFDALDYPDSKPDLTGPPTPIPAKNSPFGALPSVFGSTGPSYPVIVDPMGYGQFWSSQNTAAHQYWVGNRFYSRRSMNLNLQPTGPSSQRTCSLMDGFGFDETGAPRGPATGQPVERELRYNWLWILQRPDNTVRNTATMTVVVFDKRAFQYAPQNAEFVMGTAPGPALPIQMVPLGTSIQIPTTQGVPPVQKGGWIMDATYIPPGATAPFGTAPNGMRHAIFYRVVSVTDNPANNSTDLELQTPIRRLDGSTIPFNGTLIFVAGVSEVFERPNLTANDF